MSPDTDFERVVDQVADMLHERIGLRPDPSLRGRLRRAIREASEHGQEPSAYFATLVAGSPAAQRLLNRITVQETAFFRHPEHFEVLARDVLPALPQPVTIWSAACANGQEAYTLAMVLEELGIDGRVIATDLSTAALARTTAALYSGRELSGLSPERIARHMRQTDRGWVVAKAVRDRVSTMRFNLLDPLPPEVRSCEVVFCRNVLIYLSPVHAKAFLDRVADTLPRTTALFLGAAETIWQVSDRFKAVAVDDTFIHRQPSIAPAALQVVQRDARHDARHNARHDAQRDARHDARRDAPAEPSRRRAKSVAARLVPHRSSSSRKAPAESPSQESSSPAALLAIAGQLAVAAGDYAAAVVAFRKCAYLAPHDAMAQLHLGLALEAAGDHRSAQRAYAVARAHLADAEQDSAAAGDSGYATTELLAMLDAKQQVITP
jgi:chemotaxis methyl-accepting protein methylase